MAVYNVQRTSPTIYLDKSGKAVNGYIIEFFVPEFDETHTLNVPTLDPKLVSDQVTALIEKRRAIANLGSEEAK